MKLLRTVLVLLALVVIGAFSAQWLSHQASAWGEVFIRVGHYNVSASLPGAVLSLIATLLVLRIVWNLLLLPFRKWGRYRKKRARAQLIDGLEALQQGYWKRAEKQLSHAAKNAEAGTVANTAALHAAQMLNDTAAIERHKHAIADRNTAIYALILADDALERGQPQQALEAFESATAQPLSPRALLLKAKALAHIGRAHEAKELLVPIRQQKVLSDEAYKQLEAQLTAQCLQQAGDAQVLADRWESIPKALRIEPTVAAAQAQRAAAFHWDKAAIQALEGALGNQWNDTLIALYGSLDIGHLDSRLNNARHWLNSHPDNPALLLTLARLARQHDQWLQAQDFLHRAIAQGAGADAWEELAHGYAEQGEERLARRSYANALAATRGETISDIPARDLRQQIHDQAANESRDAHGVPHLRADH